MNKTINILAIAFLFLFQSCCCYNSIRFPYSAYYNHVKGNDKSDTHFEQMEILKRFGLDTLNNYELKCRSVDSLTSDKYCINQWTWKHGGEAAMVQLRMYDNSGNFVGGFERRQPEDSKPLKALDSIPFKKIRQLHFQPNLKLIDDINLLKINQEQTKKLLATSKNYNYTILALYASWEGWYCNSTLRGLAKYLKKHQDKKILVITVNTSKPC